MNDFPGLFIVTCASSVIAPLETGKADLCNRRNVRRHSPDEHGQDDGGADHTVPLHRELCVVPINDGHIEDRNVQVEIHQKDDDRRVNEFNHKYLDHCGDQLRGLGVRGLKL